MLEVYNMEEEWYTNGDMSNISVTLQVDRSQIHNVYVYFGI